MICGSYGIVVADPNFLHAIVLWAILSPSIKSNDSFWEGRPIRASLPIDLSTVIPAKPRKNILPQICCAGDAPFADAYKQIFGLLLDEVQLHAHLQSWRLTWLSVSVPLVKVAIHTACTQRPRSITLYIFVNSNGRPINSSLVCYNPNLDVNR